MINSFQLRDEKCRDNVIKLYENLKTFISQRFLPKYIYCMLASKVHPNNYI